MDSIEHFILYKVCFSIKIKPLPQHLNKLKFMILKFINFSDLNRLIYILINYVCTVHI